MDDLQVCCAHISMSWSRMRRRIHVTGDLLTGLGWRGIPCRIKHIPGMGKPTVFDREASLSLKECVKR